MTTPFDVLATRSVPGTLEPGDVTAPATVLLTALSVERAATVDPGAGALWQGHLDRRPDGEDEKVRVSATGTWMRLDARFGAVVRRRITALPLLT